MSTLSELQSQLDQLQARQQLLEGLLLRLETQVAELQPTVGGRRPDKSELRDEILNGPLATQLQPYWRTVFEPHENTELRGKLRFREGRITPDAAFEIARLLADGSPSRLEQLGWCRVDAKFVAEAHNDLLLGR